jgi:hypothetical protein
MVWLKREKTRVGTETEQLWIGPCHVGRHGTGMKGMKGMKGRDGWLVSPTQTLHALHTLHTQAVAPTPVVTTHAPTQPKTL